MKTVRETSRGFSVSEVDVSMTLTNSAAETTVFSQMINAGTMGLNKTLSFRIVCSLTTPALVVPTLTIKIKLGTGSLTVLNGVGLSISQTNKPLIIEGMIGNKSATTQYAYSNILQAPSLLSGSTGLADGTWSVDTTQAQTFSVTAQFSAASTSTILVPQLIQIDVS